MLRALHTHIRPADSIPSRARRNVCVVCVRWSRCSRASRRRCRSFFLSFTSLSLPLTISLYFRLSLSDRIRSAVSHTHIWPPHVTLWKRAHTHTHTHTSTKINKNHRNAFCSKHFLVIFVCFFFFYFQRRKLCGFCDIRSTIFRKWRTYRCFWYRSPRSWSPSSLDPTLTYPQNRFTIQAAISVTTNTTSLRYVGLRFIIVIIVQSDCYVATIIILNHVNPPLSNVSPKIKSKTLLKYRILWIKQGT